MTGMKGKGSPPFSTRVALDAYKASAVLQDEDQVESGSGRSWKTALAKGLPRRFRRKGRGSAEDGRPRHSRTANTPPRKASPLSGEETGQPAWERRKSADRPWKTRESGQQRPLEAAADPWRGVMQEEMTHLHQAVVSALQKNSHILVQFTGSAKGEGTSTLAREFARVSASKFMKKTLLFDADWRQAASTSFPTGTGPMTLEKVVREDLPVEQALTCVREPFLFTCLLSADPEFHPDIYSLPSMKQVWTHLKETFDVVVIDSPPAAEYHDSMAIAKDMDGIVLVVRAERTRWPVALAVKQDIADRGGKILGVAFNDRRFYVPGAIYRRL